MKLSSTALPSSAEFQANVAAHEAALAQIAEAAD